MIVQIGIFIINVIILSIGMAPVHKQTFMHALTRWDVMKSFWKKPC